MRSQAIKKVNGPNHCDVASTTTVTSKQITGRWFALQRYVKSANLLNCVPTYMTFLLRLFYQYQFYLTESKTALCELQPVEAAPAHCWAISLINLFFFQSSITIWLRRNITEMCNWKNSTVEFVSCWYILYSWCFVFLLFISCFFTSLLIFFFIISILLPPLRL